MKVLTVICFILSTLLSLSAFASSALRGKSFSDAQSHEGRKEFKINKEFQKTDNYSAITQADVALIVPMDIGTTNEGNLVRNKVLLKSANSILKSPMIKNSFLMKTAKKVEKTTQVGVEIKSQPTITNAQPTQHKFNVDIQALKKVAKLTYKGYIDSKVEYKAETDTFQVSVEEKLSKNSKIALTHQKDRLGKSQYVQYQLSW